MYQPQNSRQIVAKHQTVFDKPPVRTPSTSSVDAPLLGNGDMTVAIGGGPSLLKFHLGKNDLWRLRHGNGNSSPVPFGYLAIAWPEMEAASYTITQDLYSACTTGRFQKAGGLLCLTCYVAATDNLLVIELEATGEPLRIRTGLQVADGRGSETATGHADGVHWGLRAFLQEVDIASGAAAAFIVPAADPAHDGEFVLEPGQPVALVLSMCSRFRSEGYVEDAIARASAATAPTALRALRRAHETWWSDYWDKSFVSIGDATIEKQYYLSLYGMACCSRDPEFPPAIFGWTTSDAPEWNGDYHLNYNHQAPFYGLAQANRLEQADPHDAPPLDFRTRGRWHCRSIFGFDGVVYPVGIGPKGIETTYGIELADQGEVRLVEHGCFLLGQRTNAAYGVVNMAARWYTTRDYAYADRILPYVLDVVTFWENYLTWDDHGERFVIENDSCHENSGPDFNSALSLALVRTTLELAIDLCRALGRETDRCDRWDHILRHMSAFSVQDHGGKTVFRYCERGTAWRDSNTIGIQHIYPAGRVHLDSDPYLLEVARNTIAAMHRWHDSNGSNSFFPAAVRVGYDPHTILGKLREYSEDTWPNGFQTDNQHGIENWSTVPNTINEMLCMGHMGVIRVFPVWPRHHDAWFRSIRCRGAFLVSSELRDGCVQFVELVSEKGQQCTIENPWPGATVRIRRNGGEPQIHSGTRLRIATGAGEAIELTRESDRSDQA